MESLTLDPKNEILDQLCPIGGLDSLPPRIYLLRNDTKYIFMSVILTGKDKMRLQLLVGSKTGDEAIKFRDSLGSLGIANPAAFEPYLCPFEEAREIAIRNSADGIGIQKDGNFPESQIHYVK